VKYGSQLYYASTHWQDMRLRVLQRDSWKCLKCGQLVLGKKRNGHSPYVDHIKPRPVTVGTKSDKDVMENLQTLCSGCHNRKTAFEDNNEKKPTGPDGFPVGGEW